MRLHKREHFKEFIQCAEAARHKNEGNAVFDKANFAREKIMKVDGDIGIFVSLLFERQFDIQPNGFAFGFTRAAIGCFHDSGSAACDDGEVLFRQDFSKFHSDLVIRIGRRQARGPKDCDCRADSGHGFERVNEFSHDTENPPWILADKRGRS